MRKKLEQFMISPMFNRQAHRAAHPNQTNAEDLAAYSAGQEKILKDMRKPVSDIVAKHEGVVVNDASGYGVAGDRYEHSRYMIVQVPANAVTELKAVPDVRVERFENSTFKLPKTF